jgi:hypothetical protein
MESDLKQHAEYGFVSIISGWVTSPAAVPEAETVIFPESDVGIRTGCSSSHLPTIFRMSPAGHLSHSPRGRSEAHIPLQIL